MKDEYIEYFENKMCSHCTKENCKKGIILIKTPRETKIECREYKNKKG